MTDIEELQKSEENRVNSGVREAAEGSRSVRGSILNSPKNSHFNPAVRFSEMSVMSSINLSHQNSLYSNNGNQYYSGKHGIHDYLRYDGERELDVSMTSMYSTPRNHFTKGNFDGYMGDFNESQLDLYSNFNG